MILGAALYVLLGLFVFAVIAGLGWLVWQFIGPMIELDDLRREESTPSNNNPTRNTPDEIREQAGRGFHGGPST